MTTLPMAITDYIDGLNGYARHRLLTRKLVMGGKNEYRWWRRDPGCIIQLGENSRNAPYNSRSRQIVWKEFDRLCIYLGEAQVGAAIRDYIVVGPRRPPVSHPAVTSAECDLAVTSGELVAQP